MRSLIDFTEASREVSAREAGSASMVDDMNILYRKQ